jgi:hypothetical protein
MECASCGDGLLRQDRGQPGDAAVASTPKPTPSPARSPPRRCAILPTPRGSRLDKITRNALSKVLYNFKVSFGVAGYI